MSYRKGLGLEKRWYLEGLAWDTCGTVIDWVYEKKKIKANSQDGIYWNKTL